MLSSARVFTTAIPDFTCSNVMSGRFSENYYIKYLVNQTTSPFNTKLVYYDATSGTKAFYGCFDTKVINKILDFLTS